MDPRLAAQLALLPLSFGVIVLGLIVGVVIHELAHVAVGYAAGLRVLRVSLGPLEIRTYGRPRVRLVPSLQAGVVLVPWDRDTTLGPLRWSLFASTAAGPLAGILFGAAAIWLAGGFSLRGPTSLLQALGQASLILGVLNLLPIRTDQQLSDGRRMFALLLRTSEYAHILAATMMLGEALSGRRPRDWDPGLLGAMQRSPDEPFARLCLYEVAMDRGEIEIAGRHLDAAVELRKEKWNPSDAILFNEAAYYAARHRGDARAARTFLSLASTGTVIDYMRARAEAALLCAEGRALEGRQRAAAGLVSLERARRRDEDLCRDQLEELAHGAGVRVRPLLTPAH
ncbi:MAG: M50 family metallopeptidase [Chloroflexota bacterium]